MTFTAPKINNNPFHWHGLTGASLSFALAQLAPNRQTPLLVITPDAMTSQHLAEELRFFLSDVSAVSVLPDWETLPYDAFSPHQDIISERLKSLYQLATHPPAVLIAQVSTLMHRLMPASALLAKSLLLKCGDRVTMQALADQLTTAGYQRVNQVMEHGEFAIRGALLDLYPMGSEQPLRIDWLDDEVDTIRRFDASTQRSLDKIPEIALLPAKEYALDEAGIVQFRQSWREHFPNVHHNHRLYQTVSQGQMIGGLEYYLPLFYAQLSSIGDYLLPNMRLVWVEDIAQASQNFWQEIQERWKIAQYMTDRPALPPSALFLSPDELTQQLNKLPKIHLLSADHSRGQAYWNSKTLPDLSLDASRPDSLWRLKDWLSQAEQSKIKLLLLAESAGRREVLLELLAKSQIKVARADDWQDFITSNTSGLHLLVSPILRSFWLEDWVLLSEQTLYGSRVQQKRRRPKAVHEAFMDGVRSLAELEIGSPVVHIEHGVGRFLGLETLDHGGLAREFVLLEYANSDRLYVPVTHLDAISRYSGTSPEHAPLHRLGTDKWQKARKQALEKVKDVAAELLDLYAKRAAQKGIAFADPEEDYLKFSAGFPFEETPDQQRAIDAVKQDMCSTRPMDRLICGDVGFGKTEVAMRAAFIAVHAGKQVVVLTPTTLLANQHLQNFRDRFANWPVRVEALSRFNSAKEQNAILTQIAEGKVDIIIGTHKLLHSDIRYKDLGLIIIDEEHRFGVKQKEQLKAIRAQVDLLAMTATPIPRTLSMALADLRDMSIIATPPAKRQSIQTFVQDWNPDLVKEACMRELHRGGQIYCLFNDVEKIGNMADELTALLPNARVGIAHGQMPERELERVMRDFYHQQFNILVCTTIIETGIDIPNANTILIHRADKFGLAQLHQLRGRVGRSHHKAYAYLFTAGKDTLSADAQKRLEAIARYDQLGSGFALATQDLEIRGAGELLGHEQSGQMQEIGFDLYAQLLDRAVRAYRSGDIPNLDMAEDQGCQIDLGIPALIPDDYLPDIHSRLVLYKRINSAQNRDELHELQVEMVDRFGLLPQATKNLFAIMQIKQIAHALGINKIEASSVNIRLTFNDKPNFDPAKLITEIQRHPKLYKLEGAKRLIYTVATETAEERIEQVMGLVEKLEGVAFNEGS